MVSPEAPTVCLACRDDYLPVGGVCTEAEECELDDCSLCVRNPLNNAVTCGYCSGDYNVNSTGTACTSEVTDRCANVAADGKCGQCKFEYYMNDSRECHGVDGAYSLEWIGVSGSYILHIVSALVLLF